MNRWLPLQAARLMMSLLPGVLVVAYMLVDIRAGFLALTTYACGVVFEKLNCMLGAYYEEAKPKQ